MDDRRPSDQRYDRPAAMDSRTVRRLLDQRVPLNEIIAFAAQLEAAAHRAPPPERTERPRADDTE